jgi:hypothetical protein
MSSKVRRSLAVVALWWPTLAIVQLGCSTDGGLGEGDAIVPRVRAAAQGGLSTAGLKLEVRTAYCPANMVGQFFQVTRPGRRDGAAERRSSW